MDNLKELTRIAVSEPDLMTFLSRQRGDMLELLRDVRAGQVSAASSSSTDEDPRQVVEEQIRGLLKQDRAVLKREYAGIVFLCKLFDEHLSLMESISTGHQSPQADGQPNFEVSEDNLKKLTEVWAELAKIAERARPETVTQIFEPLTGGTTELSGVPTVVMQNRRMVNELRKRQDQSPPIQELITEKQTEFQTMVARATTAWSHRVDTLIEQAMVNPRILRPRIMGAAAQAANHAALADTVAIPFPKQLQEQVTFMEEILRNLETGNTGPPSKKLLKNQQFIKGLTEIPDLKKSAIAQNMHKLGEDVKKLVKDRNKQGRRNQSKDLNEIKSSLLEKIAETRKLVEQWYRKSVA